uniref:Phorbol-ester/DAG-type domain-containing protein n=1 Tax=Plectus sambesii TaxID=2011161 RepID=A0A914VPU2_9BILA
MDEVDSGEDQSSQRANPFDRELLMDDQHFQPSLVEAVNPTPLPAGATEEPADLAQFTSVIRRLSQMGLTRLEELTLAIGQCKEMIMQETDEKSDKRKKLVAKLIQMRYELQQLKDGEVDISEEDRTICSHQLVLQGASGRNPYCELCLTSIWRIVQKWYRCKVCGYRVHAKCVTMIKRVCAGVKANESSGYNLQICIEKGLSAQNYRCAECKADLAFGKAREKEPRLCDYTGLFYCTRCHWNDAMVIPARVVHNWDFEPRKVCRASKQLLVLLERKPLLNVEKLNPKLFNYLDELRAMRKLRHDILLMKCYFVCCKEARHLRILLHLNRHQHFVEGPELYSLQDLEELVAGKLLEEIKTIVAIFLQHIKVDCVTCRGNGFMCELCSDKTIIFPFDDSVSICRECCAVFHRQCFDRNSQHCSRCRRRRTRRLSLQHQNLDFEQPDRTSTPNALTVTDGFGEFKHSRKVEIVEPRHNENKHNENEADVCASSNPFEEGGDEEKLDATNPFREQGDYNDKLNPFAD